MTTLQLYLDDSGSRFPDHKPDAARADGMDSFALGGMLIDKADRKLALEHFDAFVSRWGIDYPLHSTKIRGRRDKFRWLGQDAVQAERFYRELGELLVSLPVTGIACVIDRPGYNGRYAEKYGEQRWLMCKTAYAILIERSLKFAITAGADLEVFFEEAGKQEDRAVHAYHKSLKVDGMPFDQGNSSEYSGLKPEVFENGVLGDPQRVTKKGSPLIQIADLYLYPMVKAGYQDGYPPYDQLFAANRVIDALLPEDCRASLGIKYSCFDLIQKGERPGD
ncbi:DUF3800 domain-containing protein [Sphingobium sp. Leaf26]|uniref:DUF3800 domain-containing protein n=1 Tax=Sphingobium sp. Leaf26 TaxID=1735693 RepID=UPI001910A12A|nr:DUF3800 domain-containing protein [Sphingobium sp. Leaf26]